MGLLEILREKNSLPEYPYFLATNLYKELNGSIHGVEKYLIHSGIFDGKWTGLVFKYERFKECYTTLVNR